MNNDNNNQPDVSHSSPWTFPEEKQFEQALVKFSDDVSDRWQMIANEIQGGKSADEMKTHYDELVHDVQDIESDLIPLPDYTDDCLNMEEEEPLVKQTKQKSIKGKAKNEGRKGKSWTEEEHRLFLYGMQKYGKGDWRSISRNIMKTRTPTQVASHAQKYFMRQREDIAKKVRKRSSIHDITTALTNVQFVTPLNTFPPNQNGYQNFYHPPPPPPM